MPDRTNSPAVVAVAGASSSATAHTPAIVRGDRSEGFLAEVERGDARPVMGRWTGDHERGNERGARAHPRDQG
ncbi:hypothetical protein PV392_04700 [Streptomyces sp. ME03-5709C]|nr:hypothetical protein [Streptomyces sp. ME03-5709C]